MEINVIYVALVFGLFWILSKYLSAKKRANNPTDKSFWSPLDDESCPNCDEKLMGYFKDRDVGKGDIFTEIMRESYVFEIIEKRCDKCDWYNTESDWAPKKIITSIDIDDLKLEEN